MAVASRVFRERWTKSEGDERLCLVKKRGLGGKRSMRGPEGFA